MNQSRPKQLADVGFPAVARLIERFGMQLHEVVPDKDIPGSFWGESEAGLIGQGLYARGDTPLHSMLHEACHYICMSPERRDSLETNAGGDYDEENAVCYLQILLAEEIPGFGVDRAMTDMDAWGYSFRLGSARAWFELDAQDASASLLSWGLVDAEHRPAWRLRTTQDDRPKTNPACSINTA